MSDACTQVVASASAGVLPALRAVDCLAEQTTSTAFDRLFGAQGALLPALTILLTLYIAFFAISLLTGRSRLGISALTPRMMTLGLVLTFSTSWVAYQSVVWTIATAVPDQIAGVILGSRGSATAIFAERIDLVVQAISNASQTTIADAGTAAPPVANAGTSPTSLMWLSTLLMLLGTVGILVTSRIALAVLLAVGPVFVLFALFQGTRGLFAGWVRAIVLTAVTPLFVVVGGGMMLELMLPVINNLVDDEGINGRSVLVLFLMSAVHLALMVMAFRVTSAIIGGWTIFGKAGSDPVSAQLGDDGFAPAGQPGQPYPALGGNQYLTSNRQQMRTLPSGFSDGAMLSLASSGNTSSSARLDLESRRMTSNAMPGRAWGIGSRFRSPPVSTKEFLK